MTSASSDGADDPSAGSGAAPPPESSGRATYQYWAALLAMVLVSTGFGIISPSLADILQEFAVTASLGSLLVSAFGAGRLIGGFPSGLVVGRIGPGRVILLGCAVFVIGSVASWLSADFTTLTIGRLIQGVGLGIVPAGVLAGMMAGARAERAGGSMALYQSGLSMGTALGPLIGGPVAEQYGWRTALASCVLAGTIALLLAVPIATRRWRRPAGQQKAEQRLGWSAALVVGLVLMPHLTTFLFRVSGAQFLLPLYASGPAGFEPGLTGLLVGSQAVTILAMLGPAGWLSNRFGVRTVTAGALVVTSLSIAAIPLVPVPYGLWASVLILGAGMAVLAVGSGLFIFTLQGYSTGGLVSIYRLSGDLMQVFGPAAVGPLVDGLGFTAACFAMSAFGLLALFSLMLRPGAPRTKR